MQVALLAEGVDRNSFSAIMESKISLVALLAEGVDRNFLYAVHPPLQSVALLAEGVDRNSELDRRQTVGAGRPPRGGRG